MPEIDAPRWGQFLALHPEAHLLQTAAWAELKRPFGWTPAWVQSGDLGAQILFRRLPLGLTIAYLPKGPVLPPGSPPGGWEPFWADVDAACTARRAIFLKVEPDAWQTAPSQALPPAGRTSFSPSLQSIQPPRTLVVDLAASEDEILGRMKQKTRYNIRLAQKKGVTAGESTDLDAFYRLMLETGQRDAFGVHSREYYARLLELFAPQEACRLILAQYEGEPLAALMVFARGGRAWYLYGASSSRRRELMAAYLVQWQAMLWARRRGCRQYDLWGVPDEDLETLEAGFETRTGGLWGVYRFKRGFGGELCRALGPFDRVYRPGLYALYRAWAARRAGEGG